MGLDGDRKGRRNISLVEAHFTENLKNKMKMNFYTKGEYLKEYNRKFFYMKYAFMQHIVIICLQWMYDFIKKCI